MKLNDELVEVLTKAARDAQALRQVRHIHRPHDSDPAWCAGCYGEARYPCPTIAAITYEQTAPEGER